MSKKDLQRQIDEIKAYVGIPEKPAEPELKPMRLRAVPLTEAGEVSTSSFPEVVNETRDGGISVRFTKSQRGYETIASLRFFMPCGVEVQSGPLPSKASWYYPRDTITVKFDDRAQIGRMYDVLVAAEDVGVVV